jgi:hypothetical protein
VMGLDSWRQKPLAHRVFLNLFYLLTLTNMRAPGSVDTAPIIERTKRKREDDDDGPTKKSRAGKVSQLIGIYNTLVYRQPPNNMGMLAERMRSFANLLRAGGAIGNWRVQEDIYKSSLLRLLAFDNISHEWFVKQLNKLLDTTFNLLMASHSAVLTKEESLALDAAYDVFVGLQSFQHSFIKPRLPDLFVS